MYQVWGKRDTGLPMAGSFFRRRAHALADEWIRRGHDPLLDENRQLKELVGQQVLIIKVQKKLAGIMGR